MKVEFKESELDIIVAALNFAGIHRPDFIDHLILQGYYETALVARNDMDDLLQNLNEVRNG